MSYNLSISGQTVIVTSGQLTDTPYEALSKLSTHKIDNKTDVTTQKIAFNIYKQYTHQMSCLQFLWDTIMKCFCITTEHSKAYKLYQKIIEKKDEKQQEIPPSQPTSKGIPTEPVSGKMSKEDDEFDMHSHSISIMNGIDISFAHSVAQRINALEDNRLKDLLNDKLITLSDQFFQANQYDTSYKLLCLVRKHKDRNSHLEKHMIHQLLFVKNEDQFRDLAARYKSPNEDFMFLRRHYLIDSPGSLDKYLWAVELIPDYEASNKLKLAFLTTLLNKNDLVGAEKVLITFKDQTALAKLIDGYSASQSERNTQIVALLKKYIPDDKS
jgi:hypothetical protein